MKDVLNKQCKSGEETIFDMKLKRSKFLVKNFTSGDITVKLGNNDSSSTIGEGCFEVVFNNIEDSKTGTAEATNIVKVTASQTGNVEVASVDF